MEHYPDSASIFSISKLQGISKLKCIPFALTIYQTRSIQMSLQRMIVLMHGLTDFQEFVKNDARYIDMFRYIKSENYITLGDQEEEEEESSASKSVDFKTVLYSFLTSDSVTLFELFLNLMELITLSSEHFEKLLPQKSLQRWLDAEQVFSKFKNYHALGIS